MKKKLLQIVTIAILVLGGVTNNVFSQNLLTNSGFEDAGASWNSSALSGSAATFSIVTNADAAHEGSNYMKVEVTTLGPKTFNIQTKTPTFQVVQGLDYEVSWWAKSDAAGSKMNLYFTDPAGQQYGGQKTLTSEWAMYSKTWTAAETGECVIKINWESLALYAIDNFSVADPNYNPGLTPQTIDFPAIDQKFTTADPFTLSVTASSNLPVSLSVVSGPATIDGSTVTLTGDPGTVTIRATQAGDDTYNPAVAVEQSFVVLQESQEKFSVPFNEVAPTIDGAATDWSGTWVSLDERKPGSTTTGMSAEFQISHDNDNIYVIISVADATPHNEEAINNAYERDNVEVFFSMHSVTADASYAEGDIQLRCQRTINGAQEWISGKQYADMAASSNFKYSAVSDATSYMIEFQFPKAVLAGTSDFDGTNFRFEIQAADNTTGLPGGRTQQQFNFDGSDGQFGDINLLGDAVLANLVTSIMSVTSSNKISAYINNNDLVVNNANGYVSVFDITGKLVLKTNINGSNVIDVSGLRRGFYIVTAKGYSVKVIK